MVPAPSERRRSSGISDPLIVKATHLWPVLKLMLHAPPGGMPAILDLDPMGAAAGAVGAIRALRHQALEPHVARYMHLQM